MKFLADESVDKPILDKLRESGFQVNSVVEIKPGIPDEEVMELAHRDNSILLTSDKDFGRLVFHRHKATEGVILIRLSELQPEHSAELVTAAIKQHRDNMAGNFSVISPHAVRIRSKSK